MLHAGARSHGRTMPAAAAATSSNPPSRARTSGSRSPNAISTRAGRPSCCAPPARPRPPGADSSWKPYVMKCSTQLVAVSVLALVMTLPTAAHGPSNARRMPRPSPDPGTRGSPAAPRSARVAARMAGAKARSTSTIGPMASRRTGQSLSWPTDRGRRTQSSSGPTRQQLDAIDHGLSPAGGAMCAAGSRRDDWSRPAPPALAESTSSGHRRRPPRLVARRRRPPAARTGSRTPSAKARTTADRCRGRCACARQWRSGRDVTIDE